MPQSGKAGLKLCLVPTALGGTPFEGCLGFLILLSEPPPSATSANGWTFDVGENVHQSEQSLPLQLPISWLITHIVQCLATTFMLKGATLDPQELGELVASS